MKKQKIYLFWLSLIGINVCMVLFTYRCNRKLTRVDVPLVEAEVKQKCTPDYVLLEEFGFTESWEKTQDNPNFYYKFDGEDRLTSLDIPASFALKNLPKSIGCFTKLLRLSIKHQPDLVLPKEIGDLLSLEELYLENNGLTEIPESIGQLKNLKEISLKQNLLSDLPSLQGLENLETIILFDNLFSDEKIAKIMSQLRPSVKLVIHNNIE